VCCGTAAGHWPYVDVGLCVVVQQRDIDVGLCVVVPAAAHWPCVDVGLRVVVQQRHIGPTWM